MTILIIMTVGLAGLFGFCLAGHTFLYRLNIAEPLKWAGAAVGGVVLGSVMAGIALMIIWPPINGLFTAGGIAVIGVLAVAATLPGGRKEQTVVCSVANQKMRKGEANEGKEVLNLDLEPITGRLQR